jgi:hypothetical protein
LAAATRLAISCLAAALRAAAAKSA